MHRNLLILDQMARNAVMGLPFLARLRLRRGRTATPSHLLTAQSLERFAYDPFAMVVDRVGIEALRGSRIAEIGPGDHIPAALLFLGHGARQYVCVDRFPGRVAGPSAKRFYASVLRDLADRNANALDLLRSRGIVPKCFPEAYPDLIQFVRSSIEEVRSNDIGTVDILMSYNVIEHVFDVAKFARNSYHLLAAGGSAVHRVDFGPHDVWQARSNPLEWLTIPSPVWKLMSSNRGTPNRMRHHEVLEHLRNAGFLVESTVVDHFTEEHLGEVQARLARRFRGAPIPSLMIRSAIFHCRKPIG